ncbi:neurochondrin [Ambystoma mexicanum]|uniref:neurochondrin n=1 Tax=Ambystoma mexicanum TaxID=8296 RepID=UPI0037E7DBCE
MASESAPDAPGRCSNPALERCLEVLRAAKDDNEQFAALLLVTKLVRAGEVDAQTRRRIFEAVGFTFPNRLLSSNHAPDGCPNHIFRALGIALLASFCTDPDLAIEPAVLDKIPIFNEVLATRCKDDLSFRSMTDDTYQCLIGIAAAPGGLKELVSRGTVASLCQAYLLHSSSREQALKLLTGLLASMEAKCWDKSTTDLMALLSSLSRDFQESEDMRKFELCEILQSFLPPSAVLTETAQGVQCLKSIGTGLLRILRSKLSACQREPALMLAASLTNSYRSDWLLAGSRDRGSTFLPLLVNLACVEVRITLEDPEPSTVDAKQQLVTACYSILEMGMQECTKDELSLLTEDQKLQLVHVMEEACGAVIHYLKQVGREKLEDPFIFASVRILSVWLAEETSSLKQEICDLLPFLVHYVKTLFQRERACRDLPQQVAELALCSSSWGALWPGDALRFLLPGLYHLTAEDVPRRILIAQEAPALLCDYFMLQWEVFSSAKTPLSSRDSAGMSLQTACGIFLNFVITTPDLIRHESCFSTLMKMLMTSLSTLLSKRENLALAANVTTLGLMMARTLADTPVLEESAAKDFMKATVRFLSRAYTSGLDPVKELPSIQLSGDYCDAWGDVSELWFLGMQAFASCLPLLQWLPPVVLEMAWPGEIADLLAGVAPASVDLEVVTAYQAILTELAKASPGFKAALLSNNWVEKANMYGMAALEQYLCDGITNPPRD